VGRDAHGPRPHRCDGVVHQGLCRSHAEQQSSAAAGAQADSSSSPHSSFTGHSLVLPLPYTAVRAVIIAGLLLLFFVPAITEPQAKN